MADRDLHIGDVHIALDHNRVWKGGSEIILSGVEYRLLWLFAENKGHLLTRETIIEAVWANDVNEWSDNLLAAAIRRLRYKLGDDFITNRRGIGYGIL